MEDNVILNRISDLELKLDSYVKNYRESMAVLINRINEQDKHICALSKELDQLRGYDE